MVAVATVAWEPNRLRGGGVDEPEVESTAGEDPGVE
jgi:hypothetical protein